MKKKLFFVPVIALLAAGCSSGPASHSMTAGASDSTAFVCFHNNSGRKLVVAFEQGALSGQAANQLAWLRHDPSGTYYWKVPAVPASNTDLQPYIFSLDTGAMLNIPVPQYAAAVGFRCLLADTAFRQNAMQQLNIDSTTQVNYMAFPNLLSASYVFDNFEAGLTVNTPGIWNITAVDFVGLPMQLATHGTKVGFKDGVTATGLQQLLAALPSPYSTGGTIAPNTASMTYRFFSPSHISMDSSLNQAIDSMVTELPHSKDTVAYGNYVYWGFTASSSNKPSTGLTATVSCNYTNAATGVTTGTPITVNDVTTANAFTGEINGAANSNANTYNAQVSFGAILSAAICRGIGGYPSKWGDIVHTATNCSTPWNYYPAGQQYDAYSRLIHSYSIDDKNYGFPYDDYFGDEAGFTAIAGDTIDVTILPYNGTFTAQPNPPAAHNTGCLVLTVPGASLYPNGNGWNIGAIRIGATMMMPGANQLCGLNSDTVVCSFPSDTIYKMKIWMGTNVSANAISYWKQGVIQPNLSITGVVYNAQTRALTFGQSASWSGQ